MSEASQNRSENPPSPSEYQQASSDYYRQMRKTHTGVYGSKERMNEEQKKKRYQVASPPEMADRIQNLGSMITLLRELVTETTEREEAVRGIDFGCGSHWLVDFVRHDSNYKWSAVGYDADDAAIQLARESFPESALHYHCRNPMRDGLPEANASQDFVFCNAVLQHFSSEEVDQSLSEIARVLRPGGVCMLIFKCWADGLEQGESDMAKPPRVLDAATRKVQFFDPTMKAEIDKLSSEERDQLDENTREGWRLFHLFTIDEIVQSAGRHGLAVMPNITRNSQTPVPGVIEYASGKKMPTACVVLERTAPGSPSD